MMWLCDEGMSAIVPIVSCKNKHKILNLLQRGFNCVMMVVKRYNENQLKVYILKKYILKIFADIFDCSKENFTL